MNPHVSATATSGAAAGRVSGASAPELIAAVAALVARYGDRTQVIVGYVDGDRLEPVPLELDLGDDPSFAELTSRATASLAHEDDGREPPTEPQRCDAVITLGSGSLDERWSTADEGLDGVRITLQEGTGPPLEALQTHLRTILEAAGLDPAQRIGRLPILSAQERRQLLAEWNDTSAPYPRRCVHELVAEQAQRTPDAVAVQCGEEMLTYAQLDARAAKLAAHLRHRGVSAEVLVGLCMERSTEMVVGLLGILKSGGAYVPIDPAYPAERQAFMLRNSQAPVVVTQERLLDALPLENVEVVCLDRESPTLASLPTEEPTYEADPEQLAYVIYTSGSTGQPKGVQIPHRALTNFLTTMRERPGLEPDDVLVAVTTLSFDIAGLELYLPLTAGARVVLAPSETASDPRSLAGLLERSGATIMQATPTTWRMLLDYGWQGRPGMKALCGGEALPVALADRMFDGGLDLWNMYGPTETTIWSTCAHIRTRGQSLTIGRPIANTTLYILDKDLQPVPVGVAGELWIGGHGLARGYRGRPDLTEERFIGHPFEPGPGARIYRTGDLARYRPDAEVEFLGRIDHQVKVRGFRIELGEIETVLSRHPGVVEAVVVARGATTSDSELAAYVIPAGEPVPAHELRQFAAQSLPAYMVPLTITTLDAFPLTPNGKVDRNALPEPTRSRSAERELTAPRTELEEHLLIIWERELGIHPIGVTDNFFDLGVTSIVAAELFAAIEHELSNRLPLGAIFRAPTIESLAKLLATGGESSRWTSLVPIQTEGSLPPIYCVHGGAGTILHLQALARRLGGDQPFYGLQSRGLYGGATPLRSVEEMASHYLAEMRQVHPGGPWRLAGYCFGTIVAFEVAHKLMAEGEEVQLLAMFNGPSPAWIKQWGWHGNQPGWRAKRAMAPRPSEAERARLRRQRRRKQIVTLLRRVPRAVRQPHRILGFLAWQTRRPRTRMLLALGRPVPERHREEFFLNLHSDAERAYEPSRYRGEILMFYGNGLYEDPTLGWEGLADEIQTFAVPGEHDNNRQAMHEPAVAFVSERLVDYLDAISGRDPRPQPEATLPSPRPGSAIRQ